MKKSYIIVLMFMSILFGSCETGLKPINYGVEQCASCKMIISDKRFGAELVTHKGKIYKYDATECLLRTLVDEGTEKYKHLGVNHFLNPGDLFDATSSYFLVSEKLPSPMGGNLSAYVDMESVTNAQKEKGGQIYDYTQILNQYKLDYGQ